MAHKFTLTGSWEGGLNGEGRIEVGAVNSQVSVPRELHGPGKGTNPEELLLGAASTCYMVTLAAMLEKRNLPVKSLSLISEATVETDGGLKISRITHRPSLVLGDVTEEQFKTVSGLFDRAEKACLIGNTLRGNVQFVVEPTLTKV